MQFNPQLRKFTESELIQKAKEVEDSTPFGDEKAYFKLYVSQMGYFFYFENPDSQKTINAEFTLTLENLAIQGEESG